MSSTENAYPCIGICMADPDSGYCLGCGRPPLPVTNGREPVVAELAPLAPSCPTCSDPDTPGDFRCQT